MIFKVLRYSKNRKNQHKITKNQYKFGTGNSRLQNRLQIRFGRVLGSVWEGVGRLLGVSWLLLGASWPFFGRSKSSFFRALLEDGLQEASWIDLGSILEGFGEGLGRIWEDLGRIFNNFCLDFGFWVVGLLGVS